VHPAGRGVGVYVHLVRHLGPDQPVFGIMDLAKNLARPVPRIASEHIRALRSTQPDGPYSLLGLSFGGVVAYEMAVQLQRQHQRVDFVAVVDTMETGIWRGLPRQSAAIRVAILAHEIADKMGRPFSLRSEDLEGLDLSDQCRRAVEALHAQRAAPRDFTAANLREDYYDVVALRESSRRGHRPRKLSGRLTLVRQIVTPASYEQYIASLSEQEVQTLGWSRLAPDGVDVFRVPGTHRSMFCEPHVRVLADRLRDALAVARASARSRA
jgi:thioesterase domain-containing protein